MPAHRIATRLPTFAALLAVLVPAAAAAEAAALLHLRAEGYAFVADVEGPPPAPAGDYLALACDGARCRLAPARADWSAGTVDSYEGAAPGFVLRGSAPAAALALLRGIDGLREGPVATEYVHPRLIEIDLNEGGDAAEPPPLDWTAGVAARRLRLAIDDPTPDGCISGGCFARWILEGVGAPVEVARADADPIYGRAGILPPADALIWAGDLDGDGRLDLLLRPQPRPDYLELRLLLGRDRNAAGEWPAAAQFYWWDPARAGC
jgi:hypothetical protein